jgi:hypothetical protein
MIEIVDFNLKITLFTYSFYIPVLHFRVRILSIIYQPLIWQSGINYSLPNTLYSYPLTLRPCDLATPEMAEILNFIAISIPATTLTTHNMQLTLVTIATIATLQQLIPCDPFI